MRADLIREFIKASYAAVPPLDIGDEYILDVALSNKTALVYFHKDTKKAVVIHRGTKGVADWANNAAYVTGYYKMTNRYKTGRAVQKRAELKYGADNVTTLGHSQGSVIARNVGRDSKQIINVNPAWMGETQSKNEYVVRAEGDPVSKSYALKMGATSVLHPSWARKHNVVIESDPTASWAQEHNSDVLARLGSREIGGSGTRASQFQYYPLNLPLPKSW
jgi:hypothetical protein